MTAILPASGAVPTFDKRERVWLEAWAAVVGAYSMSPQVAAEAADECLAAFDERFPRGGRT